MKAQNEKQDSTSLTLSPGIKLLVVYSFSILVFPL